MIAIFQIQRIDYAGGNANRKTIALFGDFHGVLRENPTVALATPFEQPRQDKIQYRELSPQQELHHKLHLIWWR